MSSPLIFLCSGRTYQWLRRHRAVWESIPPNPCPEAGTDLLPMENSSTTPGIVVVRRNRPRIWGLQPQYERERVILPQKLSRQMNEKMFNSEVRRTLHTETQDGFFLFGCMGHHPHLDDDNFGIRNIWISFSSKECPHVIPVLVSFLISRIDWRRSELWMPKYSGSWKVCWNATAWERLPFVRNSELELAQGVVLEAPLYLQPWVQSQ